MEHLIKYWLTSGIVKNDRIIRAVRAVPREKFILEEYEEEAYGDYPLPLIQGQTISQPTTVVIMLEALKLREGQKVLEIGAGSGWNAALIGHVVGKRGMVYATEIIKELADFAEKNIKKLKIKNVKIIHTDGSQGYEKEAPYDRIIVTAACPKMPPPLIEQLKEGGIIVAPVESFLGQKMVRAVKKGKDIIEENLGSFAFVPLKGKFGYA